MGKQYSRRELIAIALKQGWIVNEKRGKRLTKEEYFMYPKYYMYPAIFQPDGDMWTVTFPDIDNAFTSADTLEEAIIDARAVLEDCMYFREIQNDDIPVPSKMDSIDISSGGLVQMVAAFMEPVRALWEVNEPAQASA